VFGTEVLVKSGSRISFPVQVFRKSRGFYYKPEVKKYTVDHNSKLLFNILYTSRFSLLW